MNQQELYTEANLPPEDPINVVAVVLRFYRMAVRRKWIIMAWLTLSLSTGAAYYLTADRVYQSRTELIVLRAGGNVLDQDQSSQTELTHQMPTFERILQSDEVVKVAMANAPREHLSDFLGKSPDHWTSAFRSRLSVATARGTNVMTITYRSQDPETAYVIVGSLLDSYLKFMNSLHQNTARTVLEILQREKLHVEQDLRERQDELMQLKREATFLVGADNQPTNVLSERVLELNRTLVEAKKQTVDARAQWLAIERAVQRGEDVEEVAIQLNRTLGSKMLALHSGVSGNDRLLRARIEQDLLKDQSDLRTKLETHGASHPTVVEIRDRIMAAQAWLSVRQKLMSDELSRVTSQELGPRLVALVRRQYELAHYHEQEVHRQYLQERNAALEIGNQLARHELLQSEIRDLQKHYGNLLEVIKEKSLSKDNGLKAKPITPPSIDRRPVSPKLAVTGLLSVLAGLFLGGLSVYVMDLIDDRFHSPDDLRQTLNAPILAIIRKLPAMTAVDGLESLYPFARPNSVESEAFRSLRTAIDFAPEELKTLTISSTEPSDGKTTVMASLAVAFAQAGKRTLIIDGDMRRPGTTRLFRMSSQEGLATVLKDTLAVPLSARTRIVSSGMDNLDILPSGGRPVNPAELLSSERMSELIGWAETQYDQVLVDAPPSLAVTDVQVIGRHVNAAILIVRPDKNRRKMVIRAAEALTLLGCPLAGLVVNHVEANQSGDYAYGYGYGYGYGEGYGHDEHDEHAGQEQLAA